MQNFIRATLLLFSSFSLFAQVDTVRIMHYNLLNFGNNGSFCTSNNNNLFDKDADLETIAAYVQPDILTVNEVGDNALFLDRIRVNSLNKNGITHFKRAAYSNVTNSNLVNGLFYNSQKLELATQSNLTSNSTRDIMWYKMYSLASIANGNPDTVFLNVIVCHLKAGSGTSDRNTRDTETTNLMNGLNFYNVSGNILLCGDLNVRSSSEASFQNLLNNTNTNYQFKDPVNALGSWNNSNIYSNLHTQSTATSNSCKSGGGLDDRFDFILANSSAMNDSAGVKYISGSYRTIGQDGNRFNQSVISNNNSAPFNVIQALSDMSDHLPVVADFTVTPTLSLSTKALERSTDISVFGMEKAYTNFYNLSNSELDFYLYDLKGRLLEIKEIAAYEKGSWVHDKVLDEGLYLIRIESDAKEDAGVIKILKR